MSTPDLPERLLVVLPAWNEQETIAGVLCELSISCPDTPLLVVSDGSTDRTAEIARQAGARVLELPFNLGVGGAMRAGFRYAVRHGFDHVVQIDADGQHDPMCIPSLWAAARSDEADLMIGARFAGEGSYRTAFSRRVAMRFLSVTLSRVAKTTLTDTTSGLKLAGPRAVHLFARDFPAEYLGDTVEALVIAARSGLVVRQTPVTMRERQGGVASHAPAKAALFLGRVLLAVGVALTRPITKADSS